MIQRRTARTLGLILLVCGAIATAEPADTAAAIRKHRMGTLVIQTAPGAKVTVTQRRHEFWFGTAIAQSVFAGKVADADKAKYLSVLKGNFNAAVHENALKWYSTEKARGRINYANADKMLAWCEANGLQLRGHAVFWGVDKYVQPWIKELDDAELRTKVEARARDVMTRYKGRIPEYDVNNEMMHGSYYAKRLGDSIRHDMFKWCCEADPDARLYVNDYSVLTGGALDKYEKQIRGLLDAGVPVGGIGLQGHFGKNGVNPGKVKAVLDRLAAFNLPIKITEFDVNTNDETLKARSLVDLYTTAFAHPAVDGILMWGFWEGRHWRPNAAIWKKDWTPTPSVEAYRKLVYENWWTRYEGTADAQGRCELRAFYGTHEVRVDDGEAQIVTLAKRDGHATMDLTTR